jgi:HEPN domain-containing protein
MATKGEFLKERAEKFLRNAKNLLKDGDFDLAAFNFEQAAQLFLKYYLFISVGSYPFSHSIEELLLETLKIHPRKEEIESILENQKEILKDLEEAYISSRYLPSSFLKNQVEKMDQFVENLKEILSPWA